MVINYASSPDAANQVVEQIQSNGGNAIALQAKIFPAGVIPVGRILGRYGTLYEVAALVAFIAQSLFE